MSDNVLAAIISGSIGLFGVSVGLFWNRNAAKKAVDLSFEKVSELLKQQEFVRVATQFKNSILETKHKLVSGVKNESQSLLSTLDILKADSLTLDKAYFRFRHYISKDDLASFDSVWKDYICEPKEDDVLDENFENCYMPYRDNDTQEWIVTEEECRQLALERIDKLIEFTNK